VPFGREVRGRGSVEDDGMAIAVWFDRHADGGALDDE